MPLALVATKDRAMAAVARDYKLVDTAPNEEEALRTLFCSTLNYNDTRKPL
jgi:hypothetical protein